MLYCLGLASPPFYPPFYSSPLPASEPSSLSVSLAASGGAFRGDYKVITWNSQALMAGTDDRHEPKVRVLANLLRKADVVMVTDTHGTQGYFNSWTPPHQARGWWSARASTGHAAVGILVWKSSLLNLPPMPGLLSGKGVPVCCASLDLRVPWT